MPSLAELRKKRIEESKKVQDKKDNSESEKSIEPRKKSIGSRIKNLPEKEKRPFNIKQFLTEMATESEFERLIYKALFGKVARGSNEEIEKDLELGLKKFRELII